jgi:hypothetical protein
MALALSAWLRGLSRGAAVPSSARSPAIGARGRCMGSSATRSSAWAHCKSPCARVRVAASAEASGGPPAVSISPGLEGRSISICCASYTRVPACAWRSRGSGLGLRPGSRGRLAHKRCCPWPTPWPERPPGSFLSTTKHAHSSPPRAIARQSNVHGILRSRWFVYEPRVAGSCGIVVHLRS